MVGISHHPMTIDLCWRSCKITDYKQGNKVLEDNSVSGIKKWELFQYYRSEIKHEHSLLLGRITWYITCQSFLLTVYVISYSNSKHPNWFSNILLPILAIAITFLACLMIEGATKTIEMWRELQFNLIKNNQELNPILIDRWRSKKEEEKKDDIHFRALWFPRFVTVLFGITWFLIAFLSWRYPWMS
jgi:hypothetical protein